MGYLVFTLLIAMNQHLVFNENIKSFDLNMDSPNT